MSFDALLANNPICKLLGIRYPVLQAGMYTVAYGRLAAAVSKAGGLGCIGSAYMKPEDLAREIRLVKSETDKPFGVDILFAEVRSEDNLTSAYTQEVEEHIAVTFEEKVPVIVSGLGDPGRIVPKAHDAGMKVMSVIGTSRHAKKVEASGVDAVIASGHEGGGHVGRIGTLPLIASVVDSVSIPVIAAGGISDGRGLMAALSLGAHGIWMGTRFIATEEARAHENYKAKIVEINEDGTTVTRAHSGKNARMARNKFTDGWVGRETEIKAYPYQLREVGEPASVRGRLEGDTEHGVVPMGQGSGTIQSVKPAGDVVVDVVSEARAVFDGWRI
ncbi:MAG: nitronate monooxygenase [Pseudomonadota bacterium]